MALSILVLVIGGLLAGCDGSSPARSETNLPEMNNEMGENNSAPNEGHDQNAAPTNADAATSKPGHIFGEVEEIQGRELRVRLTESGPSDDCPESEVVGFIEERQTVLFDENTVFEIRVIANRVFARTEPGSSADIYPHDSITVYGQDQGDVFLAEKIAIWVIE